MTYLYEQKSKVVLIKQRLRSLFIQNSLERVSAKNQLDDYSKMLSSNNKELWALHLKLEKIRHKINTEYDSYDYGNGYFYQSMPEICVSGYRDTQARVEQLKLKERLRAKRVLDIGSNTGFVLLSIADSIKSGVGVEFNPYLVEMGNEVQEYFGYKNVDQLSTSFENYETNGKTFDAVLSLANHSTYDGNTKQSLDDYFGRIAQALNPQGMLIFESHPPEIEPKEKLEITISTIEKYFDVVEKPIVAMSRFLDKNRTYLIANKKGTVNHCV